MGPSARDPAACTCEKSLRDKIEPVHFRTFERATGRLGAMQMAAWSRCLAGAADRAIEWLDWKAIRAGLSRHKHREIQVSPKKSPSAGLRRRGF